MTIVIEMAKLTKLILTTAFGMRLTRPWDQMGHLTCRTLKTSSVRDRTSKTVRGRKSRMASHPELYAWELSNEPVLPQPIKPSVQKFDYFLVIDFEATCDNQPAFGPPEIIEFPCLKVNSRSFCVESEFHTFVKPTVNPQLTPFCTQLIGTIQGDLDGAPTLQETLTQFHDWLYLEGLLREGDKQPSAAFMTHGDWDLGTMLPGQCSRLGIQTPPYFGSWINVKASYSQAFGRWSRGMKHLLDELDLTLVGRHHSGIDDCHNIKQIAEAIVKKKKFVYDFTTAFDENIKKAKPL